MTSRRHRSPTRALLTGLLAFAVLGTPAGAWADDQVDPNLDQTIAEGAPIVHGARVLDSGHVDLGPRFDDGQWRFLVHDDVAKADAAATSVWRYPDETVLHVLDEAELTVPDDPAYSFLGAEAGATVWVVPQTQNPEVVWLGWNTQDPEVMASIERGVTLSLLGVQGPGTVSVYLQSGSFGEPQVLFDSRVTQAQPVWVDVNTHTHANWVFTAPGVYLLQLRADATLVDGSTVSDTQVVRFAVGTATSTDGALAAAWEGAGAQASTGAAQPSGTAEASGAVTAGAQPGTGVLVPVLLGLIGLVALGLIGALTVVVVRANRTRRSVLAARARMGPAVRDGAGGQGGSAALGGSGPDDGGAR